MSSTAPQRKGLERAGVPPPGVALNALAPASEGFIANVKVALPPEDEYVYQDDELPALTSPT
jgi:hypothetical protein